MSPIEPDGARPAPSYLDWMRGVAARLGNRYEDRVAPAHGMAMMRGLIGEAHSDAATPQLSLQLCVAGDYELVADLGAGRFRQRRRAGDMIIGPPDQPLQLSGGSKAGIDMMILALDWADILAVSEGIEGAPLRDFGPLHGGLVRDRPLAAVIETLWDELCLPGALPRLYVEGAKQLAIARLLRLARDHRPRPSPALAPWQLNRVMDLLVARFDEELSVAELAGAIGMSPFHFARAFKASTGRPPHRRQMELRIERARAMLAGTKLSVIEIAIAVGYESPQTFARLFRQLMGMTPSEYRRRAGGVAGAAHPAA